MPGPLERHEPGRDAGGPERVVEVAHQGAAAGGTLLGRRDPRAQVEDPVLERVLLRLQGDHGLHERRALLRRVADPRGLAARLGGDQEAQRDERAEQGDLPRRDGPEAGERRVTARLRSAPPRRSGRAAGAT